MKVYDDRLDFVLPDFTRLAWASAQAQAVWEPRLAQISQAWTEVEWRSVAAGVRRCALTRVPLDALPNRLGLWAEHGLHAVPLSFEGVSTGSYRNTREPVRSGRPLATAVVVGGADAAAEFQRAWASSDHDQLGELLGFPRCCREFFDDIWIRNDCVDTTWPMALSTAGAASAPTTVTVAGNPEANILWRWMGARLVPHLPCSFRCEGTVALGGAFRGVFHDLGYHDEVRWLEQVLTWPVEWSALHGIAEIKTPILKVTSRTDATGGRYTVRREGTGYPAEGATGLGFPYQQANRPMLTESVSYKRGLSQPIQIEPHRPPWYHRDNGFPSRHRMNQLHAPIVKLATEELHGTGGQVLDLGCGNGALLQKICSREDLIAHGVDNNPEAIAHAGILHESAPKARFTEADIFDVDRWLDGDYALALLMVGRLLEVDEAKAASLLSALRDHARRLIVYVYPGGDARPLTELAARAGLNVDLAVDADRTGSVGIARGF